MSAPHKVVEMARSDFGDPAVDEVADYETYATEELAETAAENLNASHGTLHRYWEVRELDDEEFDEWHALQAGDG
jgi:hypothetical protein